MAFVKTVVRVASVGPNKGGRTWQSSSLSLRGGKCHGLNASREIERDGNRRLMKKWNETVTDNKREKHETTIDNRGKKEIVRQSTIERRTGARR